MLDHYFVAAWFNIFKESPKDIEKILSNLSNKVILLLNFLRKRKIIPIIILFLFQCV